MEDWLLMEKNNSRLNYVKDGDLRMSIGEEFYHFNEVERIKEFLKYKVQSEGICKLVGWDVAFKEWTEEHGENGLRI